MKTLNENLLEFWRAERARLWQCVLTAQTEVESQTALAFAGEAQWQIRLHTPVGIALNSALAGEVVTLRMLQ